MSGPDDMKKTPDDVPLENFLRGDDALTRAYRAGTRDEPPADLDRAVLKLAQDEATKKSRIRRWEWPFAAAAVLVLSFSAVLSLRENPSVQPALSETAALSTTEESEVVASPPAIASVAPSRREEAQAESRVARPKAAPPSNYMLEEQASAEQDDAAPTAPQTARSPMAKETMRSRAGSAANAPAPAREAGFADNATQAESGELSAGVLSETQKIDRLIEHVREMKGVHFARDGEAQTAEQTAHRLEQQHLAAGNQIQTAEDFIRICAPPSDLARYPNEAERQLADVLREELGRLNIAPKE